MQWTGLSYVLAAGTVSKSALPSNEAFSLREAGLFSRTPTQDLVRLGRLAYCILVNPFCGGTFWNWLKWVSTFGHSHVIRSKRFRPTRVRASHSIGHRLLTIRQELPITHFAIRKTPQRQASWEGDLLFMEKPLKTLLRHFYLLFCTYWIKYTAYF